MKRFIAALLSMLLLSAMVFPISAAAGTDEETPFLTVSKEYGKLSATITVTSAMPMNNGTVTLSYPEELTLTSAESGIGLPPEGVNSVNSELEGEVTVSWATLSAETKDKTVLKLQLTGPSGQYKILISATTLANGEDKLEGTETGVDAFPIDIILSNNTENPAPSTPVYPGHHSSSSPSKPNPEPEPEPQDSKITEFKDTDPTEWYSEAVEFVLDKGLMKGISADQFDPGGRMTRAMVVTVLYRAAGESDKPYSLDFSDVELDSWYTSAVAWARENGIVFGAGDGTFMPNSYITRQDMVTILYRYAVKNFDITEDSEDLASFSDADDVAPYAEEAVSWAAAAGVINGIPENGVLAIRPHLAATRAQFAMIILNLYEAAGK